MQKRTGMWGDFVKFLGDRGVSHYAAAPYLTHCRRILRDAVPLTADKILDVIDASPYKDTAGTSWRAFVDFQATQGVTFPTIPRNLTEVPPPEIIAAIRACQMSGVSLTRLSRIVWDTVPAPDGSVFFRLGGKLVALPADAAQVLRAWGHDDPQADCPLLPRKKNSKRGVSAETIGRWLEKGLES